MIDKKKLNLALGGVILLIGGYLAMTMMNGPQQEQGAPQEMPQQQAPQEIPMGLVVVASKDIPKGTLVLGEMIKQKRVPGQMIGPEDLEGPEYAIGKVATVDIVVGEQITRPKLMVKPSEMKLSLKVPDGKRGLTIPIDKLASLENMIKPGDKVDVIGTFPFQNQQPVVVPMFEDVLILAVGRTMAEYAAEAGYETITMALSSKEATLLLFATQLGKLNLLLRSPLDTKTSRVKEPITLEKLWATLFNINVQQQQEKQQGGSSQEQREVLPAKATPEQKIEVYSGGSKS
jgi:pilus assembly protein CpaB